jgi:hypothetical protein
MSNAGKLFTELNDEGWWSLWLQPPEKTLNRISAGEDWQRSDFAIANEFAMAANLLRDAALRSGTPWFYGHPILFLYRHALELHLKTVLPKPERPTHNLLQLRDALATWMKTTYGVDISGTWVEATITEFGAIDPSSTNFRYATDLKGNPVDLDDLKRHMDAVFLLLTGLSQAQGNDARS